MVTSRAPRAWAFRSARRTRADSGASTGAQPGMSTVSAEARADSPCETDIVYPADVGTGPGVSVHTSNS
jgi:hypothetical protein